MGRALGDTHAGLADQDHAAALALSSNVDPLMELLFVGGIMNVLWIAALAILVLLEKVAPQGAWISRATGVLLLAWGAMTLAV